MDDFREDKWTINNSNTTEKLYQLQLNLIKSFTVQVLRPGHIHIRHLYLYATSKQVCRTLIRVISAASCEVYGGPLHIVQISYVNGLF